MVSSNFSAAMDMEYFLSDPNGLKDLGNLRTCPIHTVYDRNAILETVGKSTEFATSCKVPTRCPAWGQKIDVKAALEKGRNFLATDCKADTLLVVKSPETFRVTITLGEFDYHLDVQEICGLFAPGGKWKEKLDAIEELKASKGKEGRRQSRSYTKKGATGKKCPLCDLEMKSVGSALIHKDHIEDPQDDCPIGAYFVCRNGHMHGFEVEEDKATLNPEADDGFYDQNPDLDNPVLDGPLSKRARR